MTAIELKNIHYTYPLSEEYALKDISATFEKGRLYGSVTTQEVADAIEKQLDQTIDKRKIELKEAIRTVGTSEATLRLYPGVTTQIQLKVTAVEK